LEIQAEDRLIPKKPQRRNCDQRLRIYLMIFEKIFVTKGDFH